MAKNSKQVVGEAGLSFNFEVISPTRFVATIDADTPFPEGLTDALRDSMVMKIMAHSLIGLANELTKESGEKDWTVIDPSGEINTQVH